MKVLVLYYSKTGHTLEAVNAMAEGIRESGSEADLVSVGDFKASAIADYDGIIVGSPCWAGSITSGGVAKPISKALNSLPEESLRDKRCGGISVHSKMGGATTISTLGKLLSRKGCTDYKAGPAAEAGVPFSIFKGPSVGADDEALLKAFGSEFVA
jgi:multimeric flavodoxin WrbA